MATVVRLLLEISTGTSLVGTSVGSTASVVATTFKVSRKMAIEIIVRFPAETQTEPSV